MGAWVGGVRMIIFESSGDEADSMPEGHLLSISIAGCGVGRLVSGKAVGIAWPSCFPSPHEITHHAGPRFVCPEYPDRPRAEPAGRRDNLCPEAVAALDRAFHGYLERGTLAGGPRYVHSPGQ